MSRPHVDTPIPPTQSHRAMLLAQFIKENSQRSTPERFRVLECIEEIKGSFTIDDIVEKLSTEGNLISRGTVVNTVNLLKEASLVVSVGQQRRKILYQTPGKTASRGKSHGVPFNIMLQCNKCGATRNVRDQAALSAIATRRFKAFRPINGIVTIFGLCSKCDGIKGKR